jgi:hypothetical protein
MIKLVNANFYKIEKFNQDVKYAVCIWGELRSIDNTINNFYNNLITPLNADLYLMVQNTNDNNMDSRFDLFKNNVIHKEIYNNPDNIIDLYQNYNKLKQNNNFIIDSHLKIYYNFYKIYEKYGQLFEDNYDYVIFTRSDFLHLFPFPDILRLIDTNDIFWCYDGHEHGGVNICLICVPSIYIKDYLKSFYTYLQDVNNIEKLNELNLNIESYTKLIFNENKWKIGKIQNNAFITAESFNTKTTWAKILYSETHNVYYKYQEQLDNTIDSLGLYKLNKEWTYVKHNDIDMIILK